MHRSPRRVGAVLVTRRHRRPTDGVPVIATREVHTLAGAIEGHLAWLAATNYSAATIKSRRTHLTHFLAWAEARGLRTPWDLTLSVLESYQQALYWQVRRDAPVSSTTSLAPR
jgi:site-specific recombinase XerD